MTPLAFGSFEPKGKSVGTKCRWIYTHLSGLYDEHRPDLAVIETPAETPLPKAARRFGRRSDLTAPIYGVAVGAAIGSAIASATLAEFVCVPSCTWSKGWAPTGGDGKPSRIALACRMASIEPEALGAASYRADAADAILMAVWGHRTHLRMSGVVIGVDPSMSRVGFAVMRFAGSGVG